MKISPVLFRVASRTAPRSAATSGDGFGQRTAANELGRKEILAAMTAAGTPYYDAAADQVASQAYYRDIDLSGDLFGQLHGLVTSTHEDLPYDAGQYLYPWVDLRPGMRLQSIYSPVERGPIDPLVKPTDSPKLFKRSRSGQLRLQAKLEKRASVYEQAETWMRELMKAPFNAPELAARIAMVEAGNYYNCEHGVPQVLFGKSDPMRGDLHHLFTSERDINSVRGSLPLREYPEYQGNPEIPGAEPEGYVPPSGGGFEPAGGKGPMARAVLYFMVRYPWILKGAGELGYNAEQLQTLLKWHREDPPGLYEQHRNAEIQKLQGNRNPFIDHPEWAFRTDFRPALA